MDSSFRSDIRKAYRMGQELKLQFNNQSNHSSKPSSFSLAQWDQW
jgi:hypothetical protein